MAELSEGAVFDWFESLTISLTKWEKQNFVNLYTRCSRTIEAALNIFWNLICLMTAAYVDLGYMPKCLYIAIFSDIN